MKLKKKKTLAFLLAIVLCLTSITPIVVMAGNTDEEFAKLQTAVTAYETKMENITDDLLNGQAYSGLTDAYKAYLHATALLDEQNNEDLDGAIDPDYDAGDLADTLTNATAGIAEWYPAEFNADAYYYGNTASGGFNNVVYCSPETSWNGAADFSGAIKGSYGMQFNIALPSSIVYVYDGVSDVYGPIVAETLCTNSPNNYIGYICVNDSNTDFILKQHWVGYTDTNNVTIDFWPGDEIRIINEYDNTDSYENIKDWFYFLGDGSANTNSYPDGDYSTNTLTNSTTPRYWWNRLYYSGEGNTVNYFEKIQNVVFTAYSRRKPNGGTEQKGEDNVYSLSDSYVINYEPIITTMKEMSIKIGEALTDTSYDTTGIAGYQEGGMLSIFEAMDAFASDKVNPNNYEYDYDNDVESACALCGENIKETVEKYGNVTVGSHDEDATQDEIDALKVAIDAYEEKMKEVVNGLNNGTVYTNLSDAYTYYLRAMSIYNAYTYGGNTRVAAEEATINLTNAIEAIDVWSQWTYSGAVVYHESNIATNGYSDNVIWSSGMNTTIWSGVEDGSNSTIEIGNFEFKTAVPEKVIYVYDGSEIYGPVVFETMVQNSWGAQTGYIYTVYPDDTSIFDLEDFWLGWTDQNEGYTAWPGDYIASDNYKDKIYYADNYDTEQYSTEEQENDEHSRYWWNRLYYVGDGNVDTYYDVLINPIYKAVVVDGSYSNETKGSVYSTTTQYVINYKAVLDKIENYVSDIVGAFGDDLSISDFLYGGLSEVFEALDAFTSDILNPGDNRYDYDDYPDAYVHVYGDKVKETVATYEDAKAGVDDITGGGNAYNDIIEKLTDSDIAAQIERGNDNGEGLHYTSESWNAFISAYKEAKAVIYDLADTEYVYRGNFAELLQTAYDNLVIAESMELGSEVNSFVSANEADILLNETFDGTDKQDVYFTNNTSNDGGGGYSVYVRALILVSWVDENGAYVDTAPSQNTDYILDLDTENWFKADDGYYYYKYPVNAGGDTSTLINSCYQNPNNIIDGYTLVVQVVGQCIQVAGCEDDSDIPFVTSQWGCTVEEDGTISMI